MTTNSINHIADKFILHAIQEWGDPPAIRIEAVQQVLDITGFKASATCWPIFGGIWPKPPTGEDGAAADNWLNILTGTMPRGKFEREAAHVADMILNRRKLNA